MAIPLFERSHVDEAIERLTAPPISSHPDSTKHPLVASKVSLLTPRAVLSRAAKIVKRQALFRRGFVGDDAAIGELGLLLRATPCVRGTCRDMTCAVLTA